MMGIYIIHGKKTDKIEKNEDKNRKAETKRQHRKTQESGKHLTCNDGLSGI